MTGHTISSTVAGRLDEVRAEATEARRLDPDFTLASALKVLPFENLQHCKRFLDGLRKARLPENDGRLLWQVAFGAGPLLALWRPLGRTTTCQLIII